MEEEGGLVGDQKSNGPSCSLRAHTSDEDECIGKPSPAAR